MTSKLGEMLLAEKVISEAQLKSALDTQQQIGGKLGTILVKLRYVSEDQLATFLGDQLKISVKRLPDLVVEPNVSQLIDLEVCERHQVLPLRRSKETLLAAAVDPMDLDALDDLQFLTGLRVEFAVVSRADLIRAIDYYFHGKPCPEIKDSEKARGAASGVHQAVAREGTRASPQQVLQALTELLIAKKVITREELLDKLPGKGS